MCLVWNATTVIRTEEMSQKNRNAEFLKPGEAVDYHVDIKLYQK